MLGRAHCLETLTMATLGAVLVLGCSSNSFGSPPPHRRAVAKRHRPDDLGSSFQKFCAGWMGKVWARESQNVVGLDTGDAKTPTYVEYSREYGCTVVRRDPPVGKINYREVRYARRNDAAADTEHASPQPIEITDTDEYFTYVNGKWQ